MGVYPQLPAIMSCMARRVCVYSAFLIRVQAGRVLWSTARVVVVIV